MSEEKIELKNNELCEKKRELSMEELEQVTGGNSGFPIGPGRELRILVGMDTGEQAQEEIKGRIIWREGRN